MSKFDPASISEAVTAFAPGCRTRFRDLAAVREPILELRKKRASYRAIAELLCQQGLPTGKSTVASFCHEVLGERPLRRRRPVKGRASRGTVSHKGSNAGTPVPPPSPPESAAPPSQRERSQPPGPAQAGAPKSGTRGPRIAKLRFVQPKKP